MTAAPLPLPLSGVELEKKHALSQRGAREMDPWRYRRPTATQLSQSDPHSGALIQLAPLSYLNQSSLWTAAAAVHLSAQVYCAQGGDPLHADRRRRTRGQLGRSRWLRPTRVHSKRPLARPLNDILCASSRSLCSALEQDSGARKSPGAGSSRASRPVQAVAVASCPWSSSVICRHCLPWRRCTYARPC